MVKDLILLNHADNMFDFGDRAIFGLSKICENYDCEVEYFDIDFEYRETIKLYYPFLYFDIMLGIRVIFDSEEETNRFIMEQL